MRALSRQSGVALQAEPLIQAKAEVRPPGQWYDRMGGRPRLEVGCRVRVHGVQSMPNLNTQLGTILH